MIRPGDRVKFINDTTVGTVASIEGKIARVTVEEGFDIPVLLTDIVAIDTETEKQAIRQMGVGDGTPVGTKGPRPKGNKPKPQRQGPQYGRISLVDDPVGGEEEDDLPDLVGEQGVRLLHRIIPGERPDGFEPVRQRNRVRI